MSDNSQDLRIHIISDADIKGFSQTSQSSAKLKVDTADLSDATKAQLGLIPQVNDATKKLSHTHEEAGEKMGVTSGEARRLGNELGRATGLGNLGAVAMGGVALAAFAAGKAIEFLRDTWADMQEAAKGPINITVHDDAAKIEAVAKALDTYAEAKRKATEAANTAEAQYGRENKQLEDRLKLLQEVLKAEEQEALAALATHESQMSPQSYAAAQNRIRTAFGEKSTGAEEDTQKARLDAMQKEAAALEESAAKKKAQGEALTSPRASDAQSAAIAGGAEGKKALDELQKTMEMIQRYTHPDNAQYMGETGKVLQAQDYWALQKMAGRDSSIDDVKKSVELRQAQAEAQIKLGERAEAQQKFGNEQLGQAGTESAKAAELREQIKQAMAEYNAGVQTHLGTEALGQATSALGQEHAAEGNNTLQGTRDALAALAAGTNAAAQVQAQLQQVGDSNKELHDSLFKALQDVAAENRRLAALIRNMPGGNK